MGLAAWLSDRSGRRGTGRDRRQRRSGPKEQPLGICSRRGAARRGAPPGQPVGNRDGTLPTPAPDQAAGGGARLCRRRARPPRPRRFRRRLTSGQSDAAAGAAVLPGASTDDRIAAVRARLAAAPGDAASLATLGALYLQKSRDDADPSYYPRSESRAPAGAPSRSAKLRSHHRARCAGARPPRLRGWARLRPAGPGDQPDDRSQLRGDRRRPDRARPLRGRRGDPAALGQSGAGPLFLRQGLLLPRAAR